MPSSEKSSNIELIRGQNPILLIAPHGHPKNDRDTDKLTREMAKQLNCYAVINSHYQRLPKVKDKKGIETEVPPDLEKGTANLNYLPHIYETSLEDEFLQPILDFKRIIKVQFSKLTVVIIHAMFDKNAKADGKDIDIFIGIGRANPNKKSQKNRLSIAEEKAEKLIKLLGTPKEHPIRAVVNDGGDYSGWDYRNLNQVFKSAHKDYKKNNDTKVQSFQLEIKDTGFRDTKKNINKTARLLSTALTGLIDEPTDKKQEQSLKAVILPSLDVDPATFDNEKTNILIIAPHAHPDDGAGTGDIVREIAKLIPCATIINEEYRKPKVTRYAVNELLGQSTTTGQDVIGPVLHEKTETISKKNKVLDWFNIKHVEKHLKNEFLAPIKESLVVPGNTIILFVFGISDEKFFTDHYNNNRLAGWEKTEFEHRLKIIGNSKTQAIAGNGVKNWGEEGTINNDAFEIFTKTLNNDKTFPITTKNILNTSYYAGNKVDAMNQWFSKNGYIKPETQSLTLLLRKQGVRDTQENIEATARTIANALNKVVVSTKTEEDVNKSLVSETAQKITNIFLSHAENAMLEIGGHLIEKYYGGDFRRAKHNKAVKEKSLHYLIKNIQKNDPNAPSKAWLYRSIQMTVENDDMKKALPDNDFYTYRKLSLSHKVLLLPTTDLEIKRQLIANIAEKKLTVRQLRKILPGKPEIENPALEAPKTIADLINRPNLLFNEDYASLIGKENLGNLKPQEATEITTKAQERLEQLKDEIAKREDYIKRYGKLIELLGQQLPAENY